MSRIQTTEARRRAIVEAVWRIATVEGLEGVTIRRVATEAAVSVRLVQYYFGTRDGLLLGALRALNEVGEAAALERMQRLGPDPEPRVLIGAILEELLPLDPDRRARQLVQVAYFVRLIADARLRALVVDGDAALERLVADLIRLGLAMGDVVPGVQADAESAFLVAGALGLQASVLLGQLSAEDARALIDHQVRRLFGGS